MTLPRFSFGIGDRFGKEGEAQLRALIQARDARGITIGPVWNKSNREHQIIGTHPQSTREEADGAVRATGWTGPYFVDADHINRETVDRFLPSADFFTLDVADAIGHAPDAERLEDFVRRREALTQKPIPIAGIQEPLRLSRDDIRRFGRKYLIAVRQAAETYRLIEASKGKGNFITEVSTDETDAPQSPAELLLILSELAHEGVPAQTIAPKFTGSFYKGVDYVGDVDQFAREFRADLAVIVHAVKTFQLPEGLKLSVHSGSDKFSIYGPMREAIAESGAGLHLKTAGTTWLEEVIGLAEAGGEGLAIAKEVYCSAYERAEELSGPYTAVIDIDRSGLPPPSKVEGWTGGEFAGALRHDPSNPSYDRNLRQLVHIGYKIAADMGDRFLNALQDNREVIARNVTQNLYERHIRPLFLG